VPGAVKLAGVDDAGAIGAILGAGFEDDPVLSWVFRAPHTREKLQAMFTFLVRERFIPPATTYLVDGAAIAWLPPDRELGSGDEGMGVRFAEAMVLATADDFARLAEMGEATRAAHPTETHWYLAAIATLPERRAQGLGTTLLRHTLAPVDASGIPAYLESSNPRNITLYERHGFEVAGRIDIDLDDGVFMTPMWRR